MGRMMILNGSPRASKSNSREFAQLLKRSYPGATLEYNLASQNHRDICSALESCSNLVFVFPLYVDCLPCCMLDFLSCLEKSPLAHKPTVHLIVNCGFLEPRQNEVAIDMLKLFCRKNGFPFGSSLSIGSGEYPTLLLHIYKFDIINSNRAFKNCPLHYREAISIIK